LSTDKFYLDGITTVLNSRCSILAAANPVFGRYDAMRSISENIEFRSTILSRFDLIFIIKDLKNLEQDKILAEHIIDFHINVNEIEAKKKCPIDIETLSKYISYARKNCHPRLSFGAAEILKRHYISFREIAKQREEQSDDQATIPITVRQLEAIIRLSESLAKLQFLEQANEEHVKEALQLFRFSTMKAVEQVQLIDEGIFNDKSKLKKEIQKIEDSFRVRFSIGIKVDVMY